ncbi:MAG: hypothetical protein IBX48_10455 [Thiomicrospira sp.]|uniref:hypothetical protein n=1 Tax=Thiomicrospira sp. TaxID=935 RepID=UPI001A0D4FFC|nr:hypothetical protein [Thiomicrospira sp.]MBE0494742.1 hypothetical protein [Thiomicrospira sp.]
MSFFIAVVLLVVGLLLANFLWSVKANKRMESEAKRCLQNDCEADVAWHSGGRVYTKGLALIEQNNQLRFVKQAKLCDIGLLK